jgi:hypothetical protein
MYINVPRKVVLAIIVIRENCKVQNVPGKDHMVLLVMQHVIRENCTVHKRYWEGCIGYNRNKRELYINVPGKYILAVVIIRENCT